MINDPSDNPDYGLAGAASRMLEYVAGPLSESSGAQHRVTATHSFSQDTQPTEAGSFYGEHANPTHDKSSCSYCMPGH